jgi:RNA polymerase sigma-70 factor (ECF subfamily)
MLSDDVIIQSVLDGNVQNFEVIIERYGLRIINFINKMLADYDEAENISQEVFLKLYENLKKYSMQGNFKTFVFTIARNTTLNHIKKQKRITFFSRMPANHCIDNYIVSKETPEKAIDKKQRDKDLLTALYSLKENQRLALVLKVYLEMSYKEISEITGWSISKIETLISRAKGNLKNKLQENKELIV